MMELRNEKNPSAVEGKILNGVKDQGIQRGVGNPFLDPVWCGYARKRFSAYFRNKLRQKDDFGVQMDNFEDAKFIYKHFKYVSGDPTP